MHSFRTSLRCVRLSHLHACLAKPSRALSLRRMRHRADACARLAPIGSGENTERIRQQSRVADDLFAEHRRLRCEVKAAYKEAVRRTALRFRLWHLPRGPGRRLLIEREGCKALARQPATAGDSGKTRRHARPFCQGIVSRALSSSVALSKDRSLVQIVGQWSR
jgi:hypothetical protein